MKWVINSLFFAKQSPPNILLTLLSWVLVSLRKVGHIRCITPEEAGFHQLPSTILLDEQVDWTYQSFIVAVVYPQPWWSMQFLHFFVFLGVKSPVAMCRTDHPSSTILENISSKLSRLKVLHAALVGWKIPCRKVWHETKEYLSNCYETLLMWHITVHLKQRKFR